MYTVGDLTMKTVSIKEARQKFAQLIESAGRGNPVSITRRGRKVATLSAVSNGIRMRLPDLTAFRASLQKGRAGRRATIENLRRSERA
jgi:prevent-host-death family protein